MFGVFAGSVGVAYRDVRVAVEECGCLGATMKG